MNSVAIEKKMDITNSSSQTTDILLNLKPSLAEERYLGPHINNKKKDVLLQHGSVYRNLLELVNEGASEVKNNKKNEIEEQANLEMEYSRDIARKFTHSNSVQFADKKPLLLKRRETYELSEGILTQQAFRKLDLIKFVQDQHNENQETIPYKVGFPFQHLFFSEDRSIKCGDNALTHLLKVRKGVEYSLRSLQGPSFKHIMEKAGSLNDIPPPLKDKSKTLVFDLDGTIVWTSSKMDEPDYIAEALNSKGGISKICVKIRPFLKEMLEKLSKAYEIMIFTASTKEYAQEILKLIDPTNQYISYVFTRQDCLPTKNGFFIKDLRIIQRELSKVVIIDNLVHSFGFQLDNGIPILDYEGEKQDEELYYLTEYLLNLSQSPDHEFVQTNKNYFRIARNFENKPQCL